MPSRTCRLTRKNMLVVNAASKTESPFDNVFICSSGTYAVDKKKFMHVSLPKSNGKPSEIPLGYIDSSIAELHSKEMGKGELKDIPYLTAPITHNIPSIDRPYRNIKSRQPAIEITCNALELAVMARTAAQFADDRDKTIRLRLYGKTLPIRIDSENETGQIFTGLLMPIHSTKHINGDQDDNATVTYTDSPGVQLQLQVDTGRLFRTDD